MIKPFQNTKYSQTSAPSAALFIHSASLGHSYLYDNLMEEPEARQEHPEASLKFQVLATDGRARATRLVLRHHDCRTPMFMPVGTQGK